VLISIFFQMGASFRFRGAAGFMGVLLASLFCIRFFDCPARAGAPPPPAVTMTEGNWRIVYNPARGTADFYWRGNLIVSNAFARVKLPEAVTSMDYKTHTVSQRPIRDRIGAGVEYLVESANGPADRMIQSFRLYQNTDYFITDVTISRQPGATSNYMAPLVFQSPVQFPPGDNRALKVPFDNDKWIRYEASPFGSDVTSYEVSAFYNDSSRSGLVIGSVEHDTWKTGIRSTTTPDSLASVEAFGGITSPDTRDVLPHGSISGPAIKSPAIFVGYFYDWRSGLEAYARANAAIAPARPWTKGVPFGSNSWGSLKNHLTGDKAVQVSDFFANNLQPDHFENGNTDYIGLDAYGENLTDEALREFVDHCHQNNQEAGIYFTPFTAWSPHDNGRVADTNYRYKDIYLYANGNKQILDNGVALDPTHPGTQRRIQAYLDRFKRLGFHYIKVDFMTHGALEGDRHYDPRVTTGIQAYNEGMKYLSDAAGPDIYLNLSISPLFPSQYANSRRIACDTFGAMHEVQYMLNSLTYGWWLDGVYDFNDPDHVVLDGFSDGENRARVTSAVITGNFISGDDLSAAGDAKGKKRAEKYLTNEEIDDVARIGKSFRPVEGNTNQDAAHLFVSDGKDCCYLAAFNYSAKRATYNVSLKRIGLIPNGPLDVKELWSGALSQASNTITVQLGPDDAALFKIYKTGAPL